jgi:hypothetical protein
VRLGVPGYLPPIARPLVSWMRQHVATVAARYTDTSLDELWDDAVSALLRAAVYHNADTGAFGPYARTCIHRACARTVRVGKVPYLTGEPENRMPGCTPSEEGPPGSGP